MRRPAIPLLLLTLIAAACGRVTQGGTNTNWVDCVSTADCPDGLVCSDGKCGTPGGALAVDGGADAGWQMPMPKSGSRLTVSAQLIEGEFVRLLPTHDELRDVDCAPDMAADGVARCLPTSLLQGAGSVVFADPDCTRAIIQLSGLGAPACSQLGPYLASPSTGATCPVRTSIFSSGGEVEPPASVYSWTSGAKCTGGPPTETDRFFDAIESPPNDWVAIARTVLPATRDLGVAMWNGEDGSVLRGGLTLLHEDTPCAARSVDQGLRCLPQVSATSAGLHLDATCSDTLLSTSKCAGAKVMVDRGNDDCSAPALFRFEPLPTNATLRWTGLTGVEDCGPAPSSYLDPTIQVGTRGSRIPLDSFPAIEVGATDAPFASRVLTSGGAALGMYSSACDLRPFADGNEYCVGGIGVSYFADAACTQPLTRSTRGSTCGEPTSPPLWVAEGGQPGSSCSPDTPYTAVRRVLDEYTGPVYFNWMGQSCDPHVPSDPTGAERFFRLGAPVAPATVLSPVTTEKL